MKPDISTRQIEFLLEELCVDLGFCLPPNVRAQLVRDPPTDVDEFADAVIRAEGLDLYQGIPARIRVGVRQRVRKYFRTETDEPVT